MVIIFILVAIILAVFVVYKYKYKKEGFNSNSNTSTQDSFFNLYVSRILIFLLVFFLLSTNLFAVAVSLQCNKELELPYKIASAMFAFMFGILYLIFNYYMYRVQVNNNPCVICRKDVFSL